MDAQAWGVIGTIIGSIVGFVTLYQQLLHKRKDVELEHARERTRRAETDLEKMKRDTAATKATAESAKDDAAQVNALIQLVENVVGANVKIANELPDSLNLMREAWDKQSEENLQIIQSVTQSAKDALTQLGGANERYTAIQNLIGSTHQLISDLNTKIDGLNCADKAQIKEAIREVEQEVLNKFATKEVQTVEEK